MATLAGTISLPMIVGNGMSQSAALFGAGIGTIVYLLITKFKSPVFLGSSFSYAGPMLAAFAGAASMSISYFGLLLGELWAALRKKQVGNKRMIECRIFYMLHFSKS